MADFSADAAARWVAVYTRRLPDRIARQRRDELASDLWEERHQARALGQPDRRIAVSIARRVVAGVPADVSWRMAQLAAAQGHRPVHRPERQERTMAANPPSGSWLQFRLRTRRCRSCGRRYGRKVPYCPTCKVKPGHDGIARDFHGNLPFPS